MPSKLEAKMKALLALHSEKGFGFSLAREVTSSLSSS